MAHFAKLGNGNIVETVVVVNNDILLDENGVEQEQLGIDFLRNLYNEPNAQWKQTSYNTKGGVHYQLDGETPSEDQSKSFRTRYAFVGGIYSQEHDAFLYPKNYPSWILDENLEWKAPVDYPTDGQKYNWNETNRTWDLIE